MGLTESLVSSCDRHWKGWCTTAGLLYIARTFYFFTHGRWTECIEIQSALSWRLLLRDR